MSKRFLALAIILALFWGCAPARGVYHTVERGQTLYRISRTYGVGEQYLARLNGIDNPSHLQVGQRVFIPGAERLQKVPVTVSAVPAPPRRQQSGKSGRSSSAGPETKPAPALSKKTPSAAKGDFIWPLRGRIIQGFGNSGNRTCNGVEIAAPARTPVLAAAAGQVTYSDNGIRGYGHLIIIRHDDSFFTVYGYNHRNLVQTGTRVKQGQQIALSGKPPNGGTPRLHFEIRRGKAAVNPIFYLP